MRRPDLLLKEQKVQVSDTTMMPKVPKACNTKPQTQNTKRFSFK
jgi:hypothetical protein